MKNKFGIQVPIGINNAIEEVNKNGDQLWGKAVETELKHLTNYQTFILIDSGEDVSNRKSQNSLSYRFWCQI
jgi:hypothetical protein